MPFPMTTSVLVVVEHSFYPACNDGFCTRSFLNLSNLRCQSPLLDDRAVKVTALLSSGIRTNCHSALFLSHAVAPFLERFFLTPCSTASVCYSLTQSLGRLHVPLQSQSNDLAGCNRACFRFARSAGPPGDQNVRTYMYIDRGNVEYDK